MQHHRMVVIMGVSGSGKTTVGKILSELMGGDFIEGDNFHSIENKKKMSQGIALSDEDRLPWLIKINKYLLAEYSNRSVVLACSALKSKYREILAAKLPMKFYLLNPPRSIIEKRLTQRTGHFMSPSLLTSQLEILEITEDLKIFSDDLPPSVLAEKVFTILKYGSK